MSAKIHMIDRVFERLTVKTELPDRKMIGGQSCIMYLCECSCGKTIEAYGNHLRSGRTKSCGCLRNDNVRKKTGTHGESKTMTYRSWNNMIQYARREEIAIQEEWKEYKGFLADMGRQPQDSRLLRKRKIFGFTKSNCKWDTK